MLKRRLLAGLASLTLLLAIADAAVTDILIRRGTAHEANPLMRSLFSVLTMEGALALRILIPGIFVAALWILSKKYARTFLPGLFIGVLTVICLGWGAAVASNATLV